MEQDFKNFGRFEIKKFIIGGNAIITLESESTGRWFTYRIKKSNKDDKNSPFFVSVLTGGDNESSYSYMGMIFECSKFTLTKKSKIGKDALSYKAFKIFFDLLQKNIIHEKMNVYHRGICSVCGRTITTVDSLRDGMGPICSGRLSKMYDIKVIRKKKIQKLNRKLV